MDTYILISIPPGSSLSWQSANIDEINGKRMKTHSGPGCWDKTTRMVEHPGEVGLYGTCMHPHYRFLSFLIAVCSISFDIIPSDYKLVQNICQALSSVKLALPERNTTISIKVGAFRPIFVIFYIIVTVRLPSSNILSVYIDGFPSFFGPFPVIAL